MRKYRIYSSISRIFCTKILPKKSGATYTRIYEVHCMQYKIFLRYFHSIAFYTIAIHMITLLIAYPLESHYIASLATLMECSRGKLGLFEDSDSSDNFNVF